MSQLTSIDIEAALGWDEVHSLSTAIDKIKILQKLVHNQYTHIEELLQNIDKQPPEAAVVVVEEDSPPDVSSLLIIAFGFTVTGIMCYYRNINK